MIKFIKTNSNKLIFISTMKEIVPLNKTYKKKIKDLLFIDEQKNSLMQNTNAFLNDKNFSNVLLWGEKGMGKSTLVHTVIKKFLKENKKLNFLEILSHDIAYLPEIIYKLLSSKKKFIIFIDDVSFRPFSNDFSIMKSILEGSLLSLNNNIAFYFTTNIRNLSLATKSRNLDDIEKKDLQNSIFSLSERFGLCLGFYKCNKDEYLSMIRNYAVSFKIKKDIEQQALSWSITKGGYSGRIAYQFFLDYFNRK